MLSHDIEMSNGVKLVKVPLFITNLRGNSRVFHRGPYGMNKHACSFATPARFIFILPKILELFSRRSNYVK